MKGIDMKSKALKHFQDCWRDYASFILMIIIITGMLMHIIDWRNFDLHVPMVYQGGDDMGVLVNAKQMVEQGWCYTCDRLGAPFTVQYYDFTANMMHNVGLFIMKIFALITKEPVATMNLTYLSIYYMAGMISFFVMRNIRINTWISSLSSAVFALSPYMLFRNIGHIVLTECYFVPLSILICIWIYERDDVLALDKDFFKRKINYVVIFFAFLIANNGIAYYPFFTCFIFMVTAVSKIAKTGKIKQGLRGVTAAAIVCVFVVISILPAKIYTHMNGVNTEAISRTGFEQSELYGLKIAQMFMPLNGHGIYDKYIQIYDENAFLVTENSSAYLGLLGMIGFITLLIVLFIKKNNKFTERLGFLAELNITMVLLGTIGGLGSMFAFFISPMLRGYNRISIFIEYVCILSIAILIDRYINYIHENKKDYLKKKEKLITYIIYICYMGFCVVSIWEGTPNMATPDYDINRSNYESDDNFVQAIENELEPGSMIYQLPYHIYPEDGPVNEMWDYHLYIGYVHSNTLRWSYGSVKGRAEDEWNKNVSTMPNDEMVSYLKEQGFAGIYIDRRAFVKDEWTALEQALSEHLNEAPMESENGNLSFFKF